MLLAGNFSSVPAHSYIPRGNGATKAVLTIGALSGRTSDPSRGQQRAQHRQHLRPGFRAEAAADPGDVMLDGLGRDEQLAADVAVGHAVQQQFGDLPLPVGQARRAGPGGRLAVPPPRTGRRGRARLRRLVVATVCLRSRASCSIACDTRPSGVCSAAWLASRVASQVRPNCASPRAARVTSSTSTWLASTRSQVRPAVASAFAKARCGRRPRSAPGRAARRRRARWPGCRRALPPSAAAPTTAPDCRATSSSAKASASGCCSRSTCRMRAAATHSSPSGSSANRSTEYSASTSIAAYQCFCMAPLSPLRRAMAVCSAAAHSASRRCSVELAADGDRVGRGLQLAVLHPRPAQQQPMPMGDEDRIVGSADPDVPSRTARPMTLRARTGSPPCRAASVTSAAGVSGTTPAGLALGADRLTQPRYRHRDTADRASSSALRRGCVRPARSRSGGRRSRRSSAARAAVASPAARAAIAAAAATRASGAGRASGTGRRLAWRCRRACAMLAAIRTAAARSAGSVEPSSSSASRPAVAQSPVIASASASCALSAVAPASAAAR